MTNPTTRPLTYNCCLLGVDANHFKCFFASGREAVMSTDEKHNPSPPNLSSSRFMPQPKQRLDTNCEATRSTGSLIYSIRSEVSGSNSIFNIGEGKMDGGAQSIFNEFVIPPRTSSIIRLQFKSRFLRQSEATLLVVGKRVASAQGVTLVFQLVGKVTGC
ncbi:unnamed protein product [Protopolystoma xenopodis]|uniref:Uncharacterized protein n=1 Tax=Protopolystoma xenopodis TaxID=117903 RepID=A0A3S5CML9_9PLAT|nr:unnamed protein product [Protopolystoma xenopodis]